MMIKQKVWRVIEKLPSFNFPVRTSTSWFWINNKDRIIGRDLFIKGGFEINKIEAVKKVWASHSETWRKKHFTLVDIGANIGTVCIELIKDKTFSHAIAIEPEPKNYNLLCKNITTNGLKEKIQPVSCAISDVESNILFELSDVNHGDHRVRVESETMNKYGENKRKLISVRAAPLLGALSEVSAEIQNIGLVWVDVQGHEPHVLLGAKDFLKQSHAHWIIEYWPYGIKRAGFEPEVFLDSISHYPFTHFVDLADPFLKARTLTDIKSYAKTNVRIDKFTDFLLIHSASE